MHTYQEPSLDMPGPSAPLCRRLPRFDAEGTQGSDTMLMSAGTAFTFVRLPFLQTAGIGLGVLPKQLSANTGHAYSPLLVVVS